MDKTGQNHWWGFFVIRIGRAEKRTGEREQGRALKSPDTDVEGFKEDANRNGSVYMKTRKRGNRINQSSNCFPRSECAPSFSQVLSELKQQVSDWHCTDVFHGGVNEARWDLSFPTHSSLATYVAYCSC